MVKKWLFSFLFILKSHAASSFVSFGDAADGIGTLAETWHRLSNMYFYTAIGIIMVSITTAGKLKEGAQFRPALSRSVAFLLNSATWISIILLVVHFMPEMEDIFDVVLSWIERLF
jgi:hypothetical protein